MFGCQICEQGLFDFRLIIYVFESSGRLLVIKEIFEFLLEGPDHSSKQLCSYSWYSVVIGSFRLQTSTGRNKALGYSVVHRH